MTDRSPVMVLDDMARVMSELTEMKAQYRNALTIHAAAKVAYEREMARQIVIIRNDHQQRGERLPAEDVRRALAFGEIEREYGSLLSAEADVEGIKRSIYVNESVLSGLQSELAQLRVEIGG